MLPQKQLDKKMSYVTLAEDVFLKFGHSLLKRLEMVVFEAESIPKGDSLHMSPLCFR